jgi:hypothetical protein
MRLLAPRVRSFIESARLPDFGPRIGCFRMAIGFVGSVVLRRSVEPAESATRSAVRAKSVARDGWPVRPLSHELQGF